MSGRWQAVLAGLTIAAATPAWGATRIAIGPIQRERGGALKAQLERALCATHECVPGVIAGGKPDFAKARKAGVQGMLVGSVWAEKRGRVLSMALFTTSRKPARSWVLPIGARGMLGADSLDTLVRELDEELGAPAAAPARAAAQATEPATTAPLDLSAPPPPEPAPASEATSASQPAVALDPLPLTASARAPASARGDLEPADPGLPADAVSPPEEARAPAAAAAPSAAFRTMPVQAPTTRAATQAWILAAEVGVSYERRSLRYGGATAPSGLQGIDANLLPPFVRIELQPLARATRGLAGGLGVFAQYALSVGQKTKVETAGGTEEHDTSYSRLALGVAWRVPLGGIYVVPAVSWEQVTFTVSPLNGVPVSGFPDSHLSGVKAAVGMELPFGRFTFLAGAHGVRWLSAKDLVGGSPAFFPGGTAWALEGEAGLRLALTGLLSLEVAGEWSGTRFSLQPGTTGTYQATSAQDNYMGVRGALRAEF